MMNVTRAAQRDATRQAIVEAAVAVVCADGLPAVTTRRVAQAIEVSQSAVMHHFPNRQALHTAAIGQLAEDIERDARVGMEALAASDFDAEQTFEFVWKVFITDKARAVALLWTSAGGESAYVDTVRELELKIVSMGLEAIQPITDRFDDAAAVFAFIDTVLSVIRGLVISIPVWGMTVVDSRWQASKQILLELVPPPRAHDQQHRPSDI